MNPPANDPLALSNSLERVVIAGLRARELAGIKAILGEVSKEINAFGAVLWEASNDFNYEERIGTFFALAQWFRNNAVWREHDVAARSATGYALSVHRAAFNVTDIDVEPFRSLVYKSPFLEKHDIARACVIPVEFADKSKGALNLYRQRSAEPFSDLDVLRLTQMASLLPGLYETIRDEVAYRLTTEINRTLQQTGLSFSTQSAYRRGLESLGEQLCHSIGQNLHCVDVSIFLDGDADATTMECVASILRPEDSARHRVLGLEVHSGITSNIRAGRTIRIPDLSRELDGPSSRLPYVAHLEQVLHAKNRPDTPLSLIAAPIQASGRPPFGAIRCCGTFDGPTYFGKREEDLLRVIGGQIGQFVSDARNQWKLTEENRAWLAISETLDEMRFADGSSTVNSRSVLVESVAAIAKGFGTEATVAIQMDDDKEGGYIGTPFAHSQNASVSARLRGLRGRGVGTLRVSYPRDSALAGVIQRIANLFGVQISGYYQLASLAEVHRQALMSFQHQIRAPLRHAVRRFPMASRAARLGPDANLHKQIQFLHGITRRAYRIAMTMQLFSRLEAGLPVEVSTQEVSTSELQKFLVEAVMDNNAISDPSRSIEFFVDGSTFEQLNKVRVDVDRNLFDQAINDVLDNAGKYSFPQTRVIVEGRLTRAFVVISITNVGLRIGADQVQEVVKKGVRGALAKADVAEGEGLGLWIVSEIMKAHGGRVEIIPTMPHPENTTQVRLWFPLPRSK